jgi:TonB family protein
MPKPDGGNEPPSYPESLRDAGITGEVVVKLHIHRDGTVKGAKILRKKSSATTEDEKTAAEKAFVAAVVAAVRNWKYEPAKLDGEPISIWFPVTLPFTLTGG